MSVCNPCLVTDLIPVCITNLVVGTISDPNEPVYVYVRDVTLDKISFFNATSDGGGLVTLTGLDSEPDFMPDHSYELWITKASATGLEDKEDILVENETETTECISLRFQYSDKEYTTITIKT